MVTLFGSAQGLKLNGSFLLPDSTVLVAAEAPNLDWLPASIAVTNLDVSQVDVDSRSDRSRGFIIHFNKGQTAVLRVVAFPENTVESVNKFKTNTVPGKPMGDLFVSGRRVSNKPGYYVARLGNNFVNGVPTAVAAFINLEAGTVSTGGKHNYDGPSYHARFQPFDVMSSGKIIAGIGEEFEFDWSALNSFDRNGKRAIVNNFPAQYVVVDTIGRRGMESNVVESHYPANATPAKLLVKVSRDPDVFDSLRTLGNAGSFLVLKAYREGGLRSRNLADFNTLLTDENGNPNRKGAMPDDYLFDYPCNDDTCPATLPGYLGYKRADIWTGRVGDVAIDKRNNNIYFAYTTPTVGPQLSPGGDGGGFDFQSTVVALDSNGNMRWWARLQRETVAGSPADQFVDGLAIDYINDKLVVLGRTFDTCSYSFWQGNQIQRSGNQSTFQDKFSGSNTQIEVSWLGKYELGTGQISNATYIGELDRAELNGVRNSDPNFSTWPDLNTANLNLTQTRAEVGGNTLGVDDSGRVFVALAARGRVLTNSTAFQRSPAPDIRTPNDSLPAISTSFVRVYANDLKSVKYSTLVSGVWNPRNGADGNNVTIGGVLPLKNGVSITGFHNGRKIQIPTLNSPSYGQDSILIGRSSGIIGRLFFNCVGDPLGDVGAVSAPATHCVGQRTEYSVRQGYPAHQWFLPDSNWKGSSSSNRIQITSRPGGGGLLRVVAKNQCRVSLPSIFDLQAPLANPIGSTKGVICSNGIGADTLSARGGTAGNYRWYTSDTASVPIAGATQATYIVSSLSMPTLFYVSYISGNCESLRTAVLARFGLPAAPTLTYNNGALVSSPTPVGFVREWLRNGVSIGYDGSSFIPTPSESGDYQIRITNRCGSSLSNVFTGNGVRVKTGTFGLFPNPASTTITIKASGTAIITSAVVINSQGKTIMVQEPIANQSTIGIQKLSAGFYLLRCQYANGQTETRSFLKQ